MPAEGGGGGGGGACSLCLARERRTRLVADEPRAAATLRQLAGISWHPDKDTRMCWECKAIVQKISRFKKQVLTAQTLLNTQKHDVECLSQLSVIEKTSFDKEYAYNELPALSVDMYNLDPKIESDRLDNDPMYCDVWADNVHYDDDFGTKPDELKDDFANDLVLETKLDTDEVKVFNELLETSEILKETLKSDIKTEKEEKKERRLKRKAKKSKKEKLKKLKCKPLAVLKKEIEIKKGFRKEFKKEIRKEVKKEIKKDTKKEKLELDFSEICDEILGNKEQILDARQNYRKNTGFAKSRYHCWTCIVKFNNVHEFIQHCAEKHFDDLGDFVCEICNCRFQTADLLESHGGVHNRIVYKCKLCVYLSPTPKHLVEHYRKHEGKKRVQVRVEVELPGVETLTLVKKEPTEGQLDEKTDLSGEADIAGTKGRIECNICGVKLTYKYFKKHYLAHISKERFECDYCGKICNTRRKIFEHLKGHREPKCMCDVCGKLVLSVFKLKIHMLSHVGESERPFQCTQCPKKFTGKDKLDRHMKVHEDLKPFQCPMCHNAFRVNSELTYHMKIRHNCGEVKKKTYETTAPSYTNSKRKMDIDGKEEDVIVSVHPKKIRVMKAKKLKEPRSPIARTSFISKKCKQTKKYQCNICQKTAKQKVQLVSHMVVHTGQRPFSCDECGKTFKYNTGLWGHKLIHKGEKSHVCNVCGAKFTLRGNLTAHMKIHTGEKPFMCDVCGQKFLHRRNLRNHHKVHMKYNM